MKRQEGASDGDNNPSHPVNRKNRIGESGYLVRQDDKRAAEESGLNGGENMIGVFFLFSPRGCFVPMFLKKEVKE